MRSGPARKGAPIGVLIGLAAVPAVMLAGLWQYADAEVPPAWECRTCGAEALLRVGDGTATVDHSGDKTPRSHWDMLLERRTVPELEELLEEVEATGRHDVAADTRACCFDRGSRSL